MPCTINSREGREEKPLLIGSDYRFQLVPTPNHSHQWFSPGSTKTFVYLYEIHILALLYTCNLALIFCANCNMEEHTNTVNVRIFCRLSSRDAMTNLTKNLKKWHAYTFVYIFRILPIKQVHFWDFQNLVCSGPYAIDCILLKFDLTIEQFVLVI